MQEPADAPRSTGTDQAATAAPRDPIETLRAELATIDQHPVADRVARFEHANSVLAAALAELDEV